MAFPNYTGAQEISPGTDMIFEEAELKEPEPDMSKMNEELKLLIDDTERIEFEPWTLPPADPVLEQWYLHQSEGEKHN